MKKKCEVEILYCNSICPHFYHNYYDHEHIWCNKLDQRVYVCTKDDMIFDYKQREIPNRCPLEDA